MSVRHAQPTGIHFSLFDELQIERHRAYVVNFTIDVGVSSYKADVSPGGRRISESRCFTLLLLEVGAWMIVATTFLCHETQNIIHSQAPHTFSWCNSTASRQNRAPARFCFPSLGQTALDRELSP